MNSIMLKPWIERRIPPNMLDHFKSLRKEQLILQKSVVLKDHVSLSRITLVAGCDVSYFSNGNACAGFVVLEVPNLTFVEFAFHIYSPMIDYVPTFLAYREIPGLVEAYKKLKSKPELLMVDGNGILHPYKIGIASHLGIILNLPTIGIAKQLLLGKYDKNFLSKHNFSPIMYENQEIGTAMILDPKSKPIYVSPGHFISLQTAIFLVKHYTIKRLPEPIRLADKLTRAQYP